MKSIDKAREILRKYRVGTIISSKDRDKLFELISKESITRYKWLATSDKKIDLMVANTPIGQRKVRCINIVSSDGKRIPMTLKSLDPKSSKGRTDKMRVLRNLIDYQIQAFRVEYKEKVIGASRAGNQEALHRLTHCPYTGKPMKRSSSHIHHARIPFVDLVEQWCKHTGTPLEGVSTMGVSALRDKKLENSWKEFHEQNAILEVVSKEYNLSQGRKPD